jgi:hypothetical protein
MLKRNLLDLSFGNGKDVFMSYSEMSISYQPGFGMSLKVAGMSFPYQTELSMHYLNQEMLKGHSLSTLLTPSLLISKVPQDNDLNVTFPQDMLTELNPLKQTKDSSVSLLLDIEFREDDHFLNYSIEELQREIVSQGVSYFPLCRGKEQSQLVSNVTASDTESLVTGLEVDISSLPIQQSDCKLLTIAQNFDPSVLYLFADLFPWTFCNSTMYTTVC